MNSLKDNIMLYKFVIVYIVLFTLNSLSAAIVASFLNVDWSNLSGTSKILILIVILQNWTGVMLAFFNRSIQRVEAGKTLLPDENGNGKTTTVENTVQTSVTTSKP